MADESQHGVDTVEIHGLEPSRYIQLGVLLAVITVVELGASLWVDLGDALIPVLIVLSAVKFVLVVAYFMHLRFEPILLTRLFIASFTLGTCVLLALITLFWGDLTDIV